MNSETTDPIPVLMDGTALPRHSHKLSQPWSQEPDADFRPGTVRMAWTPQALIIEADLVDIELITMAKRDNEMLWSLGDAFEMFMKLADEPGIAEMHVAPNNIRLHLAMPGPRGRRTPDSRPLPFEEMCVSPVGFTSSVVVTANGWMVNAKIPPAVLGLNEFERGERLRVSFCRYDASSGKEPVLSTTASHPVIDFHRPHEWTQVVLK